jgi:predicted amidohydrolase YtcJ
MVGDAPTYAEAVAIKDGKIVAIGADAAESDPRGPSIFPT